MGGEFEYDLNRIGLKSSNLAGRGVHILRCDLILIRGSVLGEVSHRGGSSAGTSWALDIEKCRCDPETVIGSSNPQNIVGSK